MNTITSKKFILFQFEFLSRHRSLSPYVQYFVKQVDEEEDIDQLFTSLLKRQKEKIWTEIVYPRVMQNPTFENTKWLLKKFKKGFFAEWDWINEQEYYEWAEENGVVDLTEQTS